MGCPWIPRSWSFFVNENLYVLEEKLVKWQKYHRYKLRSVEGVAQAQSPLNTPLQWTRNYTRTVLSQETARCHCKFRSIWSVQVMWWQINTYVHPAHQRFYDNVLHKQTYLFTYLVAYIRNVIYNLITYILTNILTYLLIFTYLLTAHYYNQHCSIRSLVQTRWSKVKVIHFGINQYLKYDFL